MTVITLVFTDPNDEFNVVKKKISWNTLFSNDFYTKEFSVFGKDKVNITYENNLLIIKTDANVTVNLKINAAPIGGVCVKTKGVFKISGAINLDLGFRVIASEIELDAPIISRGFIGLDTSDNPAGKVSFKKKISADQIGILTNELRNQSYVNANQGIVICKSFTNEILSYFSIYEIFEFKGTLQDVSPYASSQWGIISEEQKLKNFTKKIRYISAESIINKGTLKLSDAELHISDHLIHFNNSKTTYDHVKIFSTGEIKVCEDAVVDGYKAFVKYDKASIDGDFKINFLSMVGNSLDVTGVLWGGERLDAQISGYTTCNGIIGSEHTNLISNYLLVTLIRNNINSLFGFFTKGGVVGNKSLHINSLATVIAGGGYLYSQNLSQRSGFFANLAGIVMAYNLSEKFLFPIYLGIDMPCSPNSFRELADPEKVFRLSCRLLGSSFPMLRNAANLASVGKLMGTGASYAASSAASISADIYHDPKKHMQNVANIPGVVAGAALDTSATAFEYGKCGFKKVGKFFVTDPETIKMEDGTPAPTIKLPSKLSKPSKPLKEVVADTASSVLLQLSEVWNQHKMIDFLNYLLSAHDLYIYADMISSKATNTLIFSNDFKICMQDPSATLENIKNTLLSSMSNVANIMSAPDLGETVMKAANQELNKLLTVPVKAAHKMQSQIVGAAVSMANAMTNPDEAGNKLLEHATTAINTIDIPKAVEDARDRWVSKINDLSNATNAVFAPVAEAPITQEASALEPVAETPANPVEACPQGPVQQQPEAPEEKDSPLKTSLLDMAMILGPSIDRRSIASANFGITISGSVMEEDLLSSHNGVTIAIGTSKHSLFGYHNSGGVYSYYRNEFVGNRYSTGDTYANAMHLEANSNTEDGDFQPSKLIFDIKNSFHIGKNAKMNLPPSTHGVVRGNFIGDGNMLLRGGNLTVYGKYIVATGATHILQEASSLTASDASIYGSLDAKRGSNTSFTNATVHRGGSYSNNKSVHVGELLTFEPGSFVELSDDLINVKKLDDQGATVRALNHITVAKELYREGSWEYDGYLHEQVDSIKSTPESSLKVQEDGKYSLQARTADLNGEEEHSHVIASVDEMSAADAAAYALGTGKYAGIKVTESIDLSTKSTENITYAGARANGARVQIQTEGRVVLPSEFSRAQGLTFANYEEAEFFVRSVYATYNLPPPPPIKRHGIKKYLDQISKAFATAAAVFAHGGFNPITMAISTALTGAAYGTNKLDNHYTRKESRELEQRDLEKIRLQQKLDSDALSMQERNTLAQIENEEHIESVGQALHRLQNGDGTATNQPPLSQQKQEIVNQFAERRDLLNTQYNQQLLDTAYQHARRRDDIARHGGPVIGVGFAVQGGSTGVSTFMTLTAGNPGQTVTGRMLVIDHTFNRPNPVVHYNPQFPRVLPTITEERDEEEVLPSSLLVPDAIVRNAMEESFPEMPSGVRNLESSAFVPSAPQTTSEQTRLGSITSFAEVSPTEQPLVQRNRYSSVLDTSREEGLAARAEYSAAYLLNTAYRGAKFSTSLIDMLAEGSSNENRQLTESLEDSLAREQGYMDQGRSLQQFLRHPIDNLHSSVVNYFDNSNFEYQQAMAAGNYAQAAVIRSNMHFDVAESTVGIVAGGMGAYRSASRVGGIVAAQGSRALLWNAEHSFRFPLTLQLEAGRLNSNIPIDAIKFRNPAVPKPASKSGRNYAPTIKHEIGTQFGLNIIPDAKIGQELLDSSYTSATKKQVYNVYNGKLIKFQPDNTGGWHAYEVKPGTTISILEQVPHKVLTQMKDDGLISNKQYKNFIKNKG